MLVSILGGGLQGVELCWLARKANLKTLLIDCKDIPTARDLADHFIQSDVTTWGATNHSTAERAVLASDIVIPACENAKALEALIAWCTHHRLPLAFDPAAYAISSCKRRSQAFFIENNTPIPTPVTSENITYPFFAKPTGGSGSQGVCVVHSEAIFLERFPQGLATPNWIFERICEGISYSIEVCGTPNNYTTFAVTELVMDNIYDCQAVLVPPRASAALQQQMKQEAIKLAEALQLKGLMDLEVIDSPEGLRVLEIDARVPSQTPTAVWLATGVNILEHLIACFLPYFPQKGYETHRVVRYEHLCHKNGTFAFMGEHIMTAKPPLISEYKTYETDELLRGGSFKNNDWVATLMFVDTSVENILQRRNKTLQTLL